MPAMRGAVSACVVLVSFGQMVHLVRTPLPVGDG